MSSVPQVLLVGYKREHLFYLSGIHTQQSSTSWHFIPWSTGANWHFIPWSTGPLHLEHWHLCITMESLLMPTVYAWVPNTRKAHCGEPPRTHSLPSCFLHTSPISKSPWAASWLVFIGNGAAYSFAKLTNQLTSLCLPYLGFQPLTLLPFLSLIIKKQFLIN